MLPIAPRSLELHECYPWDYVAPLPAHPLYMGLRARIYLMSILELPSRTYDYNYSRT